MKFTLQRHIALAAMGAVQGAISSGSVPILKNVLIQAADGIVDITATNNDIQVRHAIPDVRIDVEGAITVDAGKFRDSVNSLSEGADFVFECAPKEGEVDQRASLRSGRARFTMFTLPASDFPTLNEDMSGGAGFTIAAEALIRLFTIGGSCTANEKARPYLNGAFIHQASNKALRVVSTDTRRMSWADKGGVEGIDGWAGVNLPTSTIDVVSRLLRNEAPEAQVTMDAVDTRVAFGIGRSTVVSKVIGGAYVPYERVVPTSFKAKLTADTDLMIGALNRALVMMDSETSTVTLHFEESGVAFTTRAANAGDAADAVSAEYSGDARHMNVNGAYLKDLLARIRTENVVFRICDDPSVITINETGDSDMFSFLAPQHG